MKWTIISAFGAWAGSFFGASALIIAIIALWLPRRVLINVGIDEGQIISENPLENGIGIYTVVVKNMGAKPITITNLFFHFGDKKQGDIFLLKSHFYPFPGVDSFKFPYRLEQGESFSYYLSKERLKESLSNYKNSISENAILSIRVDEVTTGFKYFKTKWTFNSFFDESRNKQ